MVKSKEILAKAKCEYCGGEHEELEIYVKNIVHLQRVSEAKLVKCTATNKLYLKVLEIDYALN